jgi:hypothetical protein
VLLLILAAIAAIFAACAGSFLAGHAAGRVFGRSEAWDELVSSEAARSRGARRPSGVRAMTPWIVLPLCLVLAGIVALAVFGGALVATRPFPDEHDEDLEQ